MIPDGNRRWAVSRGLPASEGYAHGIDPGLRLLEDARALGIAEVSVYGFTKENVRRAADQVAAFRRACVETARRAVAAGMAVRVIGDTETASFPAELRGLAARRSRGDLRVNLLVNYGWQWDLRAALARPPTRRPTNREAAVALASGRVPRIDLVVRWGGRRRLSGFLPFQCAYADFHVVDTLWPDARGEELIGSLEWYRVQEATLGG